MRVSGWASTQRIDHALDMVMPGAFDESIARLGLGGPKGIKFLAQHDREKPIGRITKLEQRAAGLWIEAEIDETISYAADLANAIKANGGLNYSIGYRVPPGGMTFIDQGENSYFKLAKVDLLEVSVVTFPCNEDCVLMLPKSLTEAIAENSAKLRALKAPSHFNNISAMVAKMRTVTEGSNR
jgi:HK97 family phage prohead protease